MKKKSIIIVSIVVVGLLLTYAGITISSANANSQDKEWGLHLYATDVSSTGLTLTLQRYDSEREEELVTGDNYWLQEKTLTGWKDLETLDGETPAYYPIAYPMDEGDEKTWTCSWEHSFGKLAPGIYRISKSSSTWDSSKHSEEEIEELNLEPTVYATFVVWPWD